MAKSSSEPHSSGKYTNLRYSLIQGRTKSYKYYNNNINNLYLNETYADISKTATIAVEMRYPEIRYQVYGKPSLS
jgi:hypothetical protein